MTWRGAFSGAWPGNRAGSVDVKLAVRVIPEKFSGMVALFGHGVLPES